MPKSITHEEARDAVVNRGSDIAQVAMDGAAILFEYIEQQRDASEWQPIKTAPTDGTHVLLYIPDWDTVSKYQEGHYNGIYWQEFDTGFCNPTHWKHLGKPTNGNS